MYPATTVPRSGAAAVAICAALALPVFAERPEPPPYYAIRDARVVTAPGETLERATVLVADGLIEAVGSDLEIPADAWIVEGEGLTLYPGLIDAMGDLGQSRGEEPSRPGGPGGPEPQIRGPEDRPATTPWLAAADLLAAEDPRLERWREAGFTAAVTVPDDGFFPGQASAIHTGEAEPAERVVATPIAQRVRFSREGRCPLISGANSGPRVFGSSRPRSAGRPNRLVR